MHLSAGFHLPLSTTPSTPKTLLISILTMSNESEAKMDHDTTKEEEEEAPVIEERIPRARADSYIESHELTRMRTRYEEITAHHERAQSRAESRRSHGPPKGFAHVRAVASDIWTHHISIIVPQDKVRDHLGMLSFTLSYILFLWHTI